MSIYRKIGDLKRFDQIISVLFKNELGYFIQKLHFKDRLSMHERLQKDKFKENNDQPERLRLIFEELGGAFIKFAQFLSLRPDLIPKAYVLEFEKLQDSVPPIPTSKIRETIEYELKRPINKIFKHFSDEPIASASIAQVHKATLVSGETVAVKVERPDVSKIMRRDIDLLCLIAKYMHDHGHTIRGADPLLVTSEFKKWTEKELNFKEEADNIEIFRENFKHDKSVIIPGVYREYSTKEVLTLEFIYGIELNNFDELTKHNYNIDKIIKIGLNAILKQVFIDGFFHADPHPGNIIIIDKNTIAFVDFGIVGSFDDKMKEDSTNLFLGIVKNDPDLIIDSLCSMGIDDEKIQGLRKELEEIIQPLQDSTLNEVIISHVLDKIIVLIQKHGFVVPGDFILFGKTLITLEGIALRYDPKFRLTAQCRSFIMKIKKKRQDPKEIAKRIVHTTKKLKNFAINIPEKTSDLLRKLKQADINLKYIDRDIRNMTMEMNKSSNRITFGLIITAIIIAATMMLQYDEIKIFNMSAFSFIGYSIAGFLIVIVIISMLKEKRY